MMRVVVGLEGHLTPECLGRDLVTLSLTPRHLLTAHSSGYVNLYRRRDSFSLEKKISRRVTSRDNITVVSLGPSLVCVGCRSGEVVLLHLSPVTVTVLTIQESVTALSGSSRFTLPSPGCGAGPSPLVQRGWSRCRPLWSAPGPTRCPYGDRTVD